MSALTDALREAKDPLSIEAADEIDRLYAYHREMLRMYPKVYEVVQFVSAKADPDGKVALSVDEVAKMASIAAEVELGPIGG